MHMSDALISPAVGATMWAVSAAVLAYSCRKVKKAAAEEGTSLMGVLGAFVFAVQMINFTIPGTGSSGHLGGGLLLGMLIGPYAGYLVMASVLVVQALFFADGGILALGCNLFNLGVIPCFVGYFLIYRLMAGLSPSHKRMTTAILCAAVIGLQLGSLGVVFQTVLSHYSSLTMTSFAVVMQPIHLVIGMVEGVVTAALVNFLRTSRPQLFQARETTSLCDGWRRGTVVKGLIFALLMLVILSPLSSVLPDGLESSIKKASGGQDTVVSSTAVHETLNLIQKKTAFWPGYEPPVGHPTNPGAGSPVAGLIGGVSILMLVGFFCWGLNRGLGRARWRRL